MAIYGVCPSFNGGSYPIGRGRRWTNPPGANPGPMTGEQPLLRDATIRINVMKKADTTCVGDGNGILNF